MGTSNTLDLPLARLPSLSREERVLLSLLSLLRVLIRAFWLSCCSKSMLLARLTSREMLLLSSLNTGLLAGDSLLSIAIAGSLMLLLLVLSGAVAGAAAVAVCCWVLLVGVAAAVRLLAARMLASTGSHHCCV
jgi:hypothetical protein